MGKAGAKTLEPGCPLCHHSISGGKKKAMKLDIKWGEQPAGSAGASPDLDTTHRIGCGDRKLSSSAEQMLDHAHTQHHFSNQQTHHEQAARCVQSARRHGGQRQSTEAPQQSHPTTSDCSRGCAGQGGPLHPGRPLASHTVAISWCCPVVLVSVLKGAPTKTCYHQSHTGALGLFQDSSFILGLRQPEERSAWSEEPDSPRRCSVMSLLSHAWPHCPKPA